MFFGGAIGLIAITILRFSAVQTQTIQQAILNLYYLIFGILMLCTSLNVHRVVDQFRFLNYYWGKGSFCLFLSGMSFCSSQVESFVRYIMTLYFLGCGLCMGALAYYDRARDVKQAEIDIGIIEQTYDVDEDEEAWIESETVPFAKQLYSKIIMGNDEKQLEEDQDETPQPGQYGIYDIPKDPMEAKRLRKAQREDKRLKEAVNSSY
ncbi:hypothetical protein FGO68_gene10358 [Halteria grandinella]|uniref:Uncharacterized protein n=1 Tax=Halteria grandinella TaxID=5974 RepID=A0A8J8NTL3_HALGN|nr:hypothetical protein FGO68_gene10358 [Halteria grandinella]